MRARLSARTHIEDLSLSRIEVTLEAKARGRLPGYKGGLLRGVLGAALHRVCCPFSGRQCEDCTLAARCVYWQVFRTPMPPGLGFGGNFAPHPFVISPDVSGKTVYERGDRLVFWLTVIGRAIPLLPYFIVAAQMAAERGLGKERIAFGIARVRTMGPGGRWHDIDPAHGGQPHVLRGQELLDGKEHGNVLRLRTLTPLRLARRGKVVRTLDLPLLLGSLARRIEALVRAHCVDTETADGGQGSNRGAYPAAEPGGIEFSQAVEGIQWRAQSKWVTRRHWSARQRREMELGGVVGEIEMWGDVGGVMGLLRAGELLHVGKSTSYGYGWYRLSRGGEPQ